ncbi:PREDICTED: CMRF35-like molecule 6 [Propithecus coquereli]|uniref:CMRF35-like molecule 6 n=1 Tax=Propithecus coquereli TaxID=379532 RepID=UPI00063F3C91|nr:PREDICTED: CMRF35-like molecule 6 [Propithecus coquereli]
MAFLYPHGQPFFRCDLDPRAGSLVYTGRDSCLALSCSSTVTGAEGGSLSVQCQYDEKYKTSNKYRRRQPCLPLWHQIVETGGSEGEVRSGRVSIADHSGDLTFTVTLENLTADDEGKYRCGIATLLRAGGLHGLLPSPSSRSLLGSVHFLLLVFLKLPLLLSMPGAVLWVHRPQRAPWTQPA